MAKSLMVDWSLVMIEIQYQGIFIFICMFFISFSFRLGGPKSPLCMVTKILIPQKKVK
jgi:hypothetical protein